MDTVEATATPAIVVTGLDADVYRRLRTEAERHGRTIENQVRAILAEPPEEREFWDRARRMRERLAATGRVFRDCVEDIREDRDR